MLDRLPCDVLRIVYAFATGDARWHGDRLSCAHRWARVCHAMRSSATSAEWRRANRRALAQAMCELYDELPTGVRTTIGAIAYKRRRVLGCCRVYVLRADAALWARVMRYVDRALGTRIAECRNLEWCTAPHLGVQDRCCATHTLVTDINGVTIGYTLYVDTDCCGVHVVQSRHVYTLRRAFAAMMYATMRELRVAESWRVDNVRNMLQNRRRE